MKFLYKFISSFLVVKEVKNDSLVYFLLPLTLRSSLFPFRLGQLWLDLIAISTTTKFSKFSKFCCLVFYFLPVLIISNYEQNEILSFPLSKTTLSNYDSSTNIICLSVCGGSKICWHL